MINLANAFRAGETMDPDVADVLETAALLDTTEIEVFRKAYASWHGRSGAEREVEEAFVAYMFAEQVPLWVRHFTRPVVAIGRKRADSALARHRRLRPPTSLHTKLVGGLSMGAIIAVLIVLMLLSVQAVATLQSLKDCHLPPCY